MTIRRSRPTSRPDPEEPTPLSPEEHADRSQACRDAALRFLSYRPRSIAEVRTRLLRQRHAPDIVDETIDWLREYEFVDDEAFAEFWTENRVLFRPRGQRLLRYELARRGVTQETARLAVEGVDEEDGAYRAAIKRATRLPHADEALFRRRLSEFLTRRGFDHEVISRVVERVWREAQVA